MIWAYVSDLSSSLGNQLSPAVDCITQKSQATGVCINSQGKIELSINTGIEEKISSLNMNIDGEPFSCGSSCQSCSTIIKEGKNMIYLSTTSANPASLTVSVNGCSPQQFSIAPC